MKLEEHHHRFFWLMMVVMRVSMLHGEEWKWPFTDAMMTKWEGMLLCCRVSVIFFVILYRRVVDVGLDWAFKCNSPFHFYLFSILPKYPYLPLR
jgi:hypothetical protein